MSAPLLAGLAACGPVPVDQAEQSCLSNAESAIRPRGEVAVGAYGGNGGSDIGGRVQLEISSDYIMQRDPSDVFNRCVLSRSGQLPTRALADQPGWRG